MHLSPQIRLINGSYGQSLHLGPFAVQQRDHRSVHAQLLQPRPRRRFPYFRLQPLCLLRLHLHIGLPALLSDTAPRRLRHLYLAKVANILRRPAEGHPTAQQRQVFDQAGRQWAAQKTQFFIQGGKSPSRRRGKLRNCV